MGTHLRGGGTLTIKLSSGDVPKLTLFKMLAPAQLDAAITPCSFSQSPAWPRWLGIYSPLCQAALMNGFQDDKRVSGIHLSDVSTFSFKSLFMLAAVCSFLTARLQLDCSLSRTPSWERSAGSTLAGAGRPFSANSPSDIVSLA